MNIKTYEMWVLLFLRKTLFSKKATKQYAKCQVKPFQEV